MLETCLKPGKGLSKKALEEITKSLHKARNSAGSLKPLENFIVHIALGRDCKRILRDHEI